MTDWRPISEAKPDTLYLVARESGYTRTRWEYLTAWFDPDFRGSDWLDIASDRLTDSGSNPLWFAELPNDPPSSDEGGKERAT